MDDELKGLLEELKTGIQSIQDRQDSLETDVYDNFLTPAHEAFDQNEKQHRYKDFSDKYGKEFDSYKEALKALEGDEFDFGHKQFDEYDALADKPDEGEYVKALICKVAKQLDKIKGALGDKQADKPSVDVKPQEQVKTEIEVKTPEEPKKEEKQEDKLEGKKEDNPEQVEDNPDDIEAFQKELDAEMEKSKRK